jgi:putative ABC transport system ATP-binding protein
MTERTFGLPPLREGLAVSGRGIVVIRGGRRVVDDVDVDVVPRQMLAVTGPSGSGKSTLLAVLAGLVAADGGTIDPADPAERSARSGVVFQSYGLLPVLTAAENVELPLQLRNVERDEVRELAETALARAGLPDIPDRLAEELSGGQRQRVAVARALVTFPALLVADEPTAELDADTAALVLRALRAEATSGAAVVLATHDPEVAALCDAQLHLVDGRVVATPMT